MRALVPAAVLVALASGCHAPATSALDPARWRDPSQLLPQDPRVREGHLANGLTYYIMSLPEASKRARLWLAVNAGSLDEDDDQRGIAHLVEHMAFRGTRRYPGAAIRDFVEHAGLDFGADLNAETGYEQTLFKLGVPTDEPGLVDQGLDVLHEWATAVTFDPAALELERKIVLEEYRLRRDTDNAKRAAGRTRREADGTRYADRDPAGDPGVVAHVPLARVVSFYRDWYRPDLMAVIVVGDIDPDAMEAEIRTRFADLRGPAAPRPAVVVSFDPARRGTVQTIADPDATKGEVEFEGPPMSTSLHTVGDLRAEVARSFYVDAFYRRLQALADADVMHGDVEVVPIGRRFSRLTWSMPVADGDAAASMRAMATEIARVEGRGFSRVELARARTSTLSDWHRAQLERGVVDGRDEAHMLASRFLGGGATPAPAVSDTILTVLASQITDDEIEQAGGDKEHRNVLLIAPSTDGIPDRDTLEAQLAVTSFMAKGEPWKYETPRLEPIMATPPSPGVIQAEHVIPELGVTQWTLANGAHVDVKPLASEHGHVTISVIGEGGVRDLVGADRDAAFFAPQLVEYLGIGELDHKTVVRVLARHHVTLRPHMNADAASLSGDAPPDELDTLLQAVHEYIAAPRERPELFPSWKADAVDRWSHAATTGELALYVDMLAYETEGDAMYARPTRERVEALDPARSLAIYRDQLGHASGLTITIVGDLDPVELRPLVERYLASLPAGTAHAAASLADPPRAVGAKTIVHTSGEAARAEVIFRAWGDGAYTPDHAADVYILERLLDRRLELKMREKLAGVYDVAADFHLQQSGSRDLEVRFTTAPENADAMVAAMQSTIDELRRGDVTADDVAILRAQSGRRHEDHLREAAWWSAKLAGAHRLGIDPREMIDASRVFARITVESIDRAAAADLVFDGSVVGILLPAPAK